MITLALEGIPNFRTYLELFIPRAISMLSFQLSFSFMFLQQILFQVCLTLTMPIMIAFLILLGVVAQKYTKMHNGVPINFYPVIL